ncbi:hypothetical protein D3C75_1358920 [compost metagenome]
MGTGRVGDNAGYPLGGNPLFRRTKRYRLIHLQSLKRYTLPGDLALQLVYIPAQLACVHQH